MNIAEQVLDKLRSIGYQIRTDGKDIILKAEGDPPPEQAKVLFEELRRCKQEAVLLLQGWTPETQTLLEWFRTATAPTEPFQLNGHTRVVNADTFYAALRMDIERGARGPRARYGAIQGDLMDLHDLLH